MNPITWKMKEHYTRTFNRYGANFQGVDWGGGINGEAKLILRYEKMLSVIKDDINRPCCPSVLDVGCGYGGLYKFALEREYDINYTGVDVCENMIAYAAKQYSEGKFICKDFLNYTPEHQFSYIICNGILTQKLEASILEMDQYARKLIQKMWDEASRGIVFNVMKSQVDFMNENLYYKSPLEILAYCMTLTDKFRMDSSYPLYEYSVYLYKDM